MADRPAWVTAHCLSGLIASLACGLAGAASTSQGLSPEATTRLVDGLDAIREDERVPAMGLALVTRERVLFTGAFGVVDLDSQRPVTPDSRFRIGSITKTFTGLLALRLAEQGKLDLDARVDRYLDPPPFVNPWAPERPVLFSQTLEHTAGLTDMTWDEFKFSDPTAPPLAKTLYLGSDERRLQWPPGIHSSYSNVGAGIAGRILEMITGTSFEALMRDEVFGPLGLDTATVLLDDTTRAHLVAGYDTDGVTPIRYWHMLFRPFGAINITPRDMATFIRLLLNRGRQGERTYLSAASIQRMEQPRTTLAARTGLTYGYGLGNYAWYRGGFLFHGHGGDGDGYLARFGYQQDLGVGYFVVVNVFRHGPLRKLRARLEAALTAGQPQPPPAREFPLGASEQRALVGTYAPATWRFGGRRERPPLHITLSDGALYKQLGEDGRRRRLVPVTATQFRHRNEPAATMAIVPTGEGDIIFQGDMGNFQKLGKQESVISNGSRSSSPAPPNR